MLDYVHILPSRGSDFLFSLNKNENELSFYTVNGYTGELEYKRYEWLEV